jgi:predicted house-cleaning noncanonical NTP pyrophosphatase (MazG superfamily)
MKGCRDPVDSKIDTSKDDHKLRVKDSITQGMREKTNQQSEKVPVSHSHNTSDLKNRLRAKLEEKKKSASTQNELETSKKLNESVDKLTTKVKSTAETSTKLDENISKAKSLLEKLKQQKNNN